MPLQIPWPCRHPRRLWASWPLEADSSMSTWRGARGKVRRFAFVRGQRLPTSGWATPGWAFQGPLLPPFSRKRCREKSWQEPPCKVGLTRRDHCRPPSIEETCFWLCQFSRDVDAYTPERACHLAYEDGDQEDLSQREVLLSIVSVACNARCWFGSTALNPCSVSEWFSHILGPSGLCFADLGMSSQKSPSRWSFGIHQFTKLTMTTSCCHPR